MVALRRWLIGSPIATERAAHEKLPKYLALPVFAADSLSSVAYATGEMMAALLLIGTGVFYYTLPLSIGIVVLLAIVATSYRQTVLAYPGGGGAYIVARDNLGLLPAQIAGASLLIDYLLTVAVSVSAGAAAIESLSVTMLHRDVNVVWVSLAGVGIITLMNLRGVKESGKVIAVPSYSFIGIMVLMIGIGVMQSLHGSLGVANAAGTFSGAHPAPKFMPGSWPEPFSIFLILHAFASGCAALTGVEAISNGVTAFKQPAGKNAAITMIWMAGLLGILFSGVSYLAVHVKALPETAAGVKLTVIAQVGHTIFGDGILFALLQVLTAIILVLAANTAFAGFPALAALIAKDGFLPRQLANVGDRLVFDRGIIVLSILAMSLIVLFQAEVTYLIPLYAVGVFLSFTLSQAGLVRRWLRLRTSGWLVKAITNGFGAVLTFGVMLIFAWVKFTSGAYLVVFLIPTLVLVFLRIHAHYASVADQETPASDEVLDTRVPKHAVLVLVPGVTRGALRAVQYARSLAKDCRAIHVEVDPEKTPVTREAWMRHGGDVPLLILNSPFRSVVQPLLEYLDEVEKETPNTQTTVVIPEFVAPHWWQHLLHGHTGLVLKLALLGRRNVVVTNVRYHLRDEHISLAGLFDVEETAQTSA